MREGFGLRVAIFVLLGVAADTASCGSSTNDAGLGGKGGSAGKIDGGGGTPSCPDGPDVIGAPAGNSHPLYPDPRYAEVAALGAKVTTVCVDTSALASHATLDALVPELVAEKGLSPGTPPCGCSYSIAFGASEPALSGNAAKAWSDAGTNEERYVVRVNTDHGLAFAQLFAASEGAAIYSLEAALALVAPDPDDPATHRAATATIVDYPSFSKRGIVEGFYGAPYTVEDRATILRLMARLRENAYIYGPKDDPYASGAAWHDAYSFSNGSAQTIQVAAHEADRLSIRFYWAISPGHADKYDFTDTAWQTLKAKLDSVHDLGVRHFALFMDDGTDGTADQQADMMNKVDDYIHAIDPNDHLIVVGARYAFGPDVYTDTFGAKLEPDIEVMWTGEAVEPATMSAADMSDVNASLKRKVTIWDNWPNQPGSFSGRSADLPSAVQGYYTNPVLNEQAAHPTLTFLQVLGPIADYLWNSDAYAASSDSEQASFDRFQPLLSGELAIVAPCPACGSNAPGWTCDFDTLQNIYYCNGATGCLTKLPCPGGCEKQPNPNPDICK